MHSDERGFTLIETLVALVIMTSVGVLFFQTVVAGSRVAHVADRQEAALLVARSRLTMLGHQIPLKEGLQQGVTLDGIAWKITVRPYLDEGIAEQDAALNAFWASITVKWRDKRTHKHRSLHLKTLKLGVSP